MFPTVSWLHSLNRRRQKWCSKELLYRKSTSVHIRLELKDMDMKPWELRVKWGNTTTLQPFFSSFDWTLVKKKRKKGNHSTNYFSVFKLNRSWVQFTAYQAEDLAVAGVPCSQKFAEFTPLPFGEEGTFAVGHCANDMKQNGSSVLFCYPFLCWFIALAANAQIYANEHFWLSECHVLLSVCCKS